MFNNIEDLKTLGINATLICLLPAHAISKGWIQIFNNNDEVEILYM